MVLKDAELDELWRALGSHRGKIREHLEVAIETEQTMASMVPERLIREYRDLKADYEHEHEALGKLQRDYTLRVTALDERIRELVELKRKYDELDKRAAEMQRQLMQRR